jgi:hypothetical protein
MALALYLAVRRVHNPHDAPGEGRTIQSRPLRSGLQALRGLPRRLSRALPGSLFITMGQLREFP